MRVSAGGWFEFYDLFMTAYIILGLIRGGQFHATGAGLSSVASFAAAGFAGMFVGTLCFGWISDRWGRKVTFLWSLVSYSVMTACMALAPSAAAIDAFRFLAGVGIGVQIVTIDAYICEIAPKARRGNLIALSQALTYTAVPVVAFLAYVCVPHVIACLDGWRWVALAGATGAVFAWPIAAGITESPRWLEGRGLAEQALIALSRIEQKIAGACAVSQSDQDGVQSQGCAPHISLRRIFEPPYRKRTAMLVAFNVFQTIGFYGFASWVPLLLFAGGITFVHSLAYTAVIACATPAGPLLAMRYADKAERKWQIAALALASSVFGLWLAVSRSPYAIVACGATVALANTWFSSAFHAYQSELYPTPIRASAVGFVYSWSRLSSIFVGYLLALVLARSGAKAAFETIALAMVISATIVGLFGPRTNRQQIEALAP